MKVVGHMILGCIWHGSAVHQVYADGSAACGQCGEERSVPEVNAIIRKEDRP